MPANPVTHPPARNTPRARAELVARFQDFHRRAVQHTGPESTLRLYCRALCDWAADPNTDLYHVERLVDEIQHALRLEAADDEEAAGAQPPISSRTGPPTG
ncbi:hypothetical protein EJV47_12575 [Hymenobacter gummosus]|uniref:Uncharacterized protein n=1 Tax=Hymenobacter gummosus TaxID=1776032 RepID=A0A3S0HN67_9BACT|nr:hypothetical protein [Hymenobacter gummosus]RTQ49646.1 hypothetical protein EJV47_12575 [Hymenobacter gummosus]